MVFKDTGAVRIWCRVRFAPGGGGKSLRVLVVEDDRKDAEIIKVTLMQMGVSEIVNTGDAEAALEVLRRRAGDLNLIICDWKLPEMSGLELLDELRARGDETPFIMFTGRATHEAVVQAAESGVTVFIPKPCPPRQRAEKILTAVIKGKAIDG